MHAQVLPDHHLGVPAPHHDILAEQAGPGWLRLLHVGGSGHHMPVIHQHRIVNHPRPATAGAGPPASSASAWGGLATPTIRREPLATVGPSNIFVQAGAYSRFDNATQARARLSSLGGVKVTSVLIGGRDLYRVRVGPMASVADADLALERVIATGYFDARIIVD